MDFHERVRRKNQFDGSLVYGIRNFNINTGRNLYADYRKRIDSAWMDVQTGKLYNEAAEVRHCPLCGANDYTLIFTKFGFDHVKCNLCELLYVNPMLNEKESKNVYDKEGIYAQVQESKEQVEMYRLEFNYYIDILNVHLSTKKDIKICDIGCGTGNLLAEARKRGFSVLGVEPNESCHKALAQKNIDYIKDNFPFEKEFDLKFDCVFMINTLEHVKNPCEALLSITKILEKNGLIFISTPNLDALVNRLMHEKAGAFGGHTHLQIFNKNTLTRLFDKCNFEILEYETAITELDTIKNYLSYKDPYFGDNPDMLDFLTPELIYKNHMAKNINMIGRLK